MTFPLVLTGIEAAGIVGSRSVVGIAEVGDIAAVGCDSLGLDSRTCLRRFSPRCRCCEVFVKSPKVVAAGWVGSEPSY